jgi:hypothetical protein
MRWSVNRRRAIAVLSAFALAAGVAACGEDDDDSDGSGATTPNAPAEKAAFTGDPVKVFMLLPIETPVSDESDTKAVIEASVAALNEAGGLNGSEIQLEHCNDTDANAELACVRKAVKDKAVAFVGSAFVFNPAPAQKELAKAKIPSIAPLAIQQVEFGTPANYPITVTSFGLLACAQQVTEATGGTKVSAISNDLPVQKELLQTIEAIANATNVSYGESVSTSVTQADFAGPVKQLANSGADLVVDALTPGSQTQFFAGVRSIGEEFKAFCGTSSNLNYDTLGQLGDMGKDVYVSTGLPATDEDNAAKFPLVAEFRDVAESVELRSPGNAFNGFLAVHVLDQAAKTVTGELTGPKMMDAMNGLAPDLSGAGLPEIDFSKPVEAPGLERLFNPIVNLLRYSPEKKEMEATDVKQLNLLELFGALQG